MLERPTPGEVDESCEVGEAASSRTESTSSPPSRRARTVTRVGSERRNNARSKLEYLRRYRLPSYTLVTGQLRTELIANHLQVTLAVVHHQALLRSHGAQQLVRQVRMVHGMVVRQLRDLVLPQQVGARVAHVGQRIALPAKHQSGERGEAAGRVAAPVQACQPRVLRTNDAIEGHGGVPGFGGAEVVAHQTGHGGLRRLAPEAARRAALREMDGMHRVGHAVRATWLVSAWEAPLQDLRQAWRGLRSTPAVSAVNLENLRGRG